MNRWGLVICRCLGTEPRGEGHYRAEAAGLGQPARRANIWFCGPWLYQKAQQLPSAAESGCTGPTRLRAWRFSG
jgi:hypothetical protein